MRKVIFIVVAIGLAWLAGQDAALAYWRSDHGGTVPGLWASDPVVRLRASEKLHAQPREFAARSQEIGAAARDVLRRTPLDVQAMRQLGVIADQGRAGAAREYIALAERITRRDLQTELMSLNFSAARPDAAATIRHYHHALSAYPLVNQRLLPIVASQLGEPDVRRALVAYADRPWLRHFVTNAIEYDVAPADLIAFYSDLEGRIPTSELQAGTVRLVQWLVSNGQYSFLSTYASRLPGLAPDAFAVIGLNAITADARFAPLSWTLLNDATVETQADGNALLVRIEPGRAGFAAARMTLLKPGAYEFVQRIDYPADTPPARLEWQVICPENPRQQLLAAEPPPAGTGAVQRPRLTIPAGCIAQFWQLRAAAASEQFASFVRISDLMLTRR